MTTRHKDTSSARQGGRNTTAAAARPLRGRGTVRVWSEASVTVCVDRDNNQFIKFTHGFEKTCPDTDVARRKAENEIYATCEKIIEARLKKLTRLIRRMESEMRR